MYFVVRCNEAIMNYCKNNDCKYYVGITLKPCVGSEEFIKNGECTLNKKP